jgi:hypothetical protein
MCFRCLSLGHRGGNAFHPPSMCTHTATYDEQRKDPERAKRLHQKYLEQIAELRAAYKAPPQTTTATSYPTSPPPPSVSNYRYPPSHHSVGPQGPLVQPWDLRSSQNSTQMELSRPMRIQVRDKRICLKSVRVIAKKSRASFMGIIRLLNR